MKPLAFKDMAIIYRINRSVNPYNVCIFQLANGNYAFLGDDVKYNPDSSPVVKKPYNEKKDTLEFSEFPNKRLNDRVRNTLKSTWGDVEVFDRQGRSVIYSHVDKLSAAVPPVEELARSIGFDDFLTAFKGGDYVTYFGDVALDFCKETGAKISFIPVPDGVDINPEFLNEKHELPAYSIPLVGFTGAGRKINNYDLLEFSEIEEYKVNSNAAKKDRFEYTSDNVYENLSDVQKRLLDDFDFDKVSIPDFMKCIGQVKPVREEGYHYIYESPFAERGELRVSKSDNSFIWDADDPDEKVLLSMESGGTVWNKRIYGDLYKLASLVSGERNVTRVKAYIADIVNEKLDVSLYLKDKPGREERSKTVQKNNSMAGLKSSEIVDAYAQTKEKHPDAILMFRSNKGYSIIKEDAEKMKDVLGVKLSSKVLPDKSRIPAVNFSKDDLDTVLPKIVRSGFRVAIIDEPQKKNVDLGNDKVMDVSAQFSRLKGNNENEIILMRVGDFYHSYGKDAEDISKAAGTTLTSVKTSDGFSLAQTMFPYSELDKLIPKFLDLGRPVAIAVPKPDNRNEYGVLERLERPGKVLETGGNKQTKETAFEEPGKEQRHRAPQMVTPNGDVVSHGHVFASAKNPEDNFFVAKINGVPLKPQLITHEESIAFIKGDISVPEMMHKYYPSKLMPKVSEEAFNLPVSLAEGKSVQKFNVYKENDPQSSDYGRYKFFARVDDKNMSTVASKKDLNAYFDRTMSPAQLVEKNFGERLGLKSYYEQFRFPEGAKIDSKDIKIFKSGNGKDYLVQVDLGDAGKTPAKVITGNDRWAMWHTKSATREQIAAKYCNDFISDFLKGGLSGRLEKKSALKV